MASRGNRQCFQLKSPENRVMFLKVQALNFVPASYFLKLLHYKDTVVSFGIPFLLLLSLIETD